MTAILRSIQVAKLEKRTTWCRDQSVQDHDAISARLCKAKAALSPNAETRQKVGRTVRRTNELPHYESYKSGLKGWIAVLHLAITLIFMCPLQGISLGACRPTVAIESRLPPFASLLRSSLASHTNFIPSQRIPGQCPPLIRRYAPATESARILPSRCGEGGRIGTPSTPCPYS